MTKRKKKVSLTGLPKPGYGWFFAALIVSLLLHGFSYLNLDHIYSNWKNDESRKLTSQEKIKVNIVPKSKKSPNENRRIIETPMTPTEAPKDARFQGAQDHIAEKETRVERRIQNKGQDPGQGGEGQKNATAKPMVDKPQEKSQKVESVAKEDTQKSRLNNQGSKIITEGPTNQQKPRNAYESLMPNAQDLVNERLAGYQDYVDDGAEIGDRIDLNTSNYRYIGYFTSVRKSFELVWTYPTDAQRRGLQGEVKIQFTIKRNGHVERIRVVETSGHKVLDDAVIEAIQLSSPYSPLPEGIAKDELTVVGSFRYVLSSYVGAY